MKKSAHKKSGWKTAQNRVKSQKQIRLAILVLIILAAVILVGQLVRFGISLNQPVTKYSHQKEYIWDGDSNLNLIIRSDKIFVLSFDPGEGEVVIAEIPPETYVNVPGGFG